MFFPITFKTETPWQLSGNSRGLQMTNGMSASGRIVAFRDGSLVSLRCFAKSVTSWMLL